MANFDPLLDAWQARQRPRSQQQQQQQQQQQFAYDLNNVNIPGLLSSPPSTSSSLSSASSSAIPLASWTPSSWSEAEMLRRGLLSDRSVDMLSAFGSDHHPHHHQFNGELGVQLKHQHQQQLFDFNFSLPINLGLSLDNTENENNNTQLYQQDPLRCSPALLTPTSSYSSSSSNCSPPTPPSPIYSQHLKHLQMFSSPTSSTKRSIFDSESVSPAPSSHSVDSSDISGAAAERAKISNNLGGSTNAAKRQRACMSTKDFVPPDVTGLSKREARLVKNRAAAFLSRQRKREEFEQMEIRVAELEQENSQLRALAESFSPNCTSTITSATTATGSDSTTHITPTPLGIPPKQKSLEEQPETSLLRSQLAASRSREADLSRQLEVIRGQCRQLEQLEKLRQDPIKDENQTLSGDISIKTEESIEHDLSSEASSPINTPSNLPNFSAQTMKSIISNPKSGASLGLMVLLCALPSLLSKTPGSASSSNSRIPTTRSVLLDSMHWDTPAFVSPSVSQLTSDKESENWISGWTKRAAEGMMDVDATPSVRCSSDAYTKESGIEEWKILDVEGLGLGQGELEIAFSDKMIGEGRVRVRVASSVPSSSLPYSSSNATSSSIPDSNFVVENIREERGPLALSATGDPFLGAGPASPLNLDFSSPTTCWNTFNSTNTAMPMEIGTLNGVNNFYEKEQLQQLRVRVKLSALPSAGREGGEWEIELR